MLKDSLMTNLFAENSKIWFKNGLELSDHISQRSTIDVFKNPRDGSIVVERVITDNDVRALRCLIDFQLLHDLFAYILLNVHLDYLSP